MAEMIDQYSFQINGTFHIEFAKVSTEQWAVKKLITSVL